MLCVGRKVQQSNQTILNMKFKPNINLVWSETVPSISWTEKFLRALSWEMGLVTTSQSDLRFSYVSILLKLLQHYEVETAK